MIYILYLLAILIIFYVLDNQIVNIRENFSNNNEIPKIIVSTYYDKNKIPQKVYDNMKEYAPNYKFKVYDDQEIALFLKKYYGKDVLNTFLTLHRGAHKADLFRYCYLYIYGGIYMDIKTKLIKNINDIFNKPNVNFYTVLSMHKPTIYQGIIATTPKNPIFLSLIEHIVNVEKPIKRYFEFTIDFYRKLKKFYDNIEFHNNMYKDKYNKYNLYLFEEKCTRNPEDCEDGLDKYKRCCYIYDKNEKIIKIRYSDYPWK
tara:strand:- start:2645 stop:3418 length:774 start_codon:yes stop_codon:yes gene_type:complete